MRIFSLTLAGLAILTVALFGALVFLVSADSSSSGETDRVLDGPLGIADRDSVQAMFPPVQEVDPATPLPAGISAAWYVAEGYVKVLAVEDIESYNSDELLVLDESRRRVFQRESVNLVNAEEATLEALGRDGLVMTGADEKLVLVGPVIQVRGELMRKVIQLTEVTATT